MTIAKYIEERLPKEEYTITINYIDFAKFLGFTDEKIEEVGIEQMNKDMKQLIEIDLDDLFDLVGVENHKIYKMKIRFIKEVFITKEFCRVEFTGWIDVLRTKRCWLSSLKRINKFVKI
ncbi:hypothetical protein [uncultured Granulicatella sp.]|uniref:hypothetical protein n=1 Tax=uncultured Granulicatella sp. TaxID=316089 RepID=UPI0028E6C61F|nr:hypothetical protein [uncultured Granulicatella sp.]